MDNKIHKTAMNKPSTKFIKPACAALLGAFILGYAPVLHAQTQPEAQPTGGQTAQFPQSIIPGEQNILKYRDSIKNALSASLPEGYTLQKILIWHGLFNPEARAIGEKMGVQSNIYVHAVLAKNGKAVQDMKIIVVANEQQAIKVCNGPSFPYAQRVGNVVVLFDQREDLADYDEVLKLCQSLGLVKA